MVGAVGLASPLRRLSAKADRHTPVCRRLLVKPTSRRFETSYITYHIKIPPARGGIFIWWAL